MFAKINSIKFQRATTSAVSIQAGMKEFDKRLSHADQYLQILIDQIAGLEKAAAETEENQKIYAPIIDSAKVFFAAIINYSFIY